MSQPTLTHNLDNEALINLFRMDIQIYHSPNTVELYLDALMRFTQSIKGNNLLDVTKQDIMTFFRRIIVNEYSHSYINLHNAALRAFYNTMKKFHIISNDRSLYLPRHRSLAGKKLPRFLGECEIARVIEDGPDLNTFKGIRDRAILELLYSTGIRAQELLSLYSGDIDFNNSTLYITGKGNKPRVVPIGGKAIEALKAYLGQDQDRQDRCPLPYHERKTHTLQEVRMGYSEPLLPQDFRPLRVFPSHSPHLRHS